MNDKTVVIYHRADFDGIFCREIAKKFLGEAGVKYIGWDYGDALPEIPSTVERIYMLDISVDGMMEDARLIWIDHHKSAMEKFSTTIAGYRIDGVAACRLAWQWFQAAADDLKHHANLMPPKQDFIGRNVSEPYAVQLAGEYDIWDKRNPDAEVFQFALRATELGEYSWGMLLNNEVSPALKGTGMEQTDSVLMVSGLLEKGHLLQRYQQERDASMVKRGFLMSFEGFTFLTLNTAFCNSLTFAARDLPETGHDALCAYYFDGKEYKVSLYHAKHRTELDLSKIATKYGGGGHRGACGFRCADFRDQFTVLGKYYL